MEIIRKQELNALLDNSFITDVHLVSTGQLNFNFTEPLIEVHGDLLSSLCFSSCMLTFQIGYLGVRMG